ncbi:DUF72 domain-containing protein [Streptomyces sp. TLI_146]|uniref:DUF72 domain-containing protein n=1 Tax=Streptomyces sp. TLI_146 TaxID=1938858 RepID=UPI000C70F655|nr:DUF72 domain-containing protein [Streptomyces sp. TLI_146]PKV82916.1 uncharacterized protein YecE (DUF72 family) [Streptomyces sp. TLI_146]
MTAILVGSCSWTSPELASSGWYPPGSRDTEGRLRHYASRFPVVEVDSTYYALPSAHNSRLWAARTPTGFTFDVKAFAALTGHPFPARALPPELRPTGPANARLHPNKLPRATLDELWARFHAGIEPLRAAGRLGSALFQFPPWFRPGAEARARIEECRARAEVPITVEFRHPDWLSDGQLDDTLRFLSELHIPLVGVDAPGMPAVAEATSPHLSVVRFHGRSLAWGTGSKEERYRHQYTAEELKPWVPRLRALARASAHVHALFNNCCGDAAVRAAETMAELLAAR